MKFTVAAIAAVSAAAAVAAPAGLDGLPKFTGTAKGTIDCNTTTKKCTVSCGPTLGEACNLVAAFDSVFYGIEALAGSTVDCTQDGCTVTCPVDGTAFCTANEAIGTFDSVFAVGETIVINGLNNFISGGGSSSLSGLGL